MAKKKTSARPIIEAPTFSVGDRVEIMHFGRGKVVTLRGRLGPNGEQVYRVMYKRRPTPAYVEVLGNQIRLRKPANDRTEGKASIAAD